MSNLRQAAQQALEAWDNPMGMKDLCVAMDAIRTALEQKKNQDLTNLLCRVHRDGGHYIAEHGLQKAIEDADIKIAKLNATSDAQQQAEPVHGDIRALKYRIHELEGEVMGYKRMLDVAEAASQPQQQTEPLAELQKRYLESEKAFQQKAEPVSHAVIVGALFDFMGWLTTRKERLILSSTDNASPAADAIKDFAEMRGLLLDDALVQDWQNYTALPQQQTEPVAWMDREGDLYKMPEIENWSPPHTMLYTAPPQRKWQGLTDEQLDDIAVVARRGNLHDLRIAIEAAHGIKEGT